MSIMSIRIIIYLAGLVCLGILLKHLREKKNKDENESRSLPSNPKVKAVLENKRITCISSETKLRKIRLRTSIRSRKVCLSPGNQLQKIPDIVSLGLPTENVQRETEGASKNENIVDASIENKAQEMSDLVVIDQAKEYSKSKTSKIELASTDTIENEGLDSVDTTITCPHCGFSAKLSDDISGKSLRCPKCRRKFAGEEKEKTFSILDPVKKESKITSAEIKLEKLFYTGGMLILTNKRLKGTGRDIFDTSLENIIAVNIEDTTPEIEKEKEKMEKSYFREVGSGCMMWSIFLTCSPLALISLAMKEKLGVLEVLFLVLCIVGIPIIRYMINLKGLPKLKYLRINISGKDYYFPFSMEDDILRKKMYEVTSFIEKLNAAKEAYWKSL